MKNTLKFNILAEAFKLFGHPIRLEIIHILSKSKHPLPVKDLVKQTRVSAVTLSPHLGRLRRLKVLHDERRSGEAFYSLIDKKNILNAYKAIEKFLNS